ncbi:MAG TPA: LLM class flavin-dependent oxidoreductase [Magnetospirillaceae bacterium]|jgi:luciferase family oxidoreductase group 1
MSSPSPFRLSVLDQSPLIEGGTGPQSLANTLDLAQLADRLGYTRYWLAEHHATGSLACTSPEVLLGPIGMVTKRIRLGTGGIMLPHYSPFKVAEVFSTLAGLFPGRVDLGIGRAPGTDQITVVALQRDRRQHMPDDFIEQMSELLAYFEDRIPSDHPFHRLSHSLPGGVEKPVVWLLGSSSQSGEWAAQLGLPYAFADFIGGGGSVIAQEYKNTFQPSQRLDKPRVVVAVRVICAETEEEALRLSASQQVQLIQLQQGRPKPSLPPDEAIKLLEQSGIRLGVAPMGRRLVVGSPQAVRQTLEKVAAEFGAQEIMVLTTTYDHDARRKSYELLADAFGLSAMAVAAD